MLGGGDVCKHKSLSSRQVGSSSRPLPAWSSGVWSKDFQVGDGQEGMEQSGQLWLVPVYCMWGLSVGLPGAQSEQRVG